MSKEIVPEQVSRLKYRFVSDAYVGHLVGNIYELVEATFSDERQREAMKSVMADKIHDWFRNTSGSDYDYDDVCKIEKTVTPNTIKIKDNNSTRTIVR